MDQIIMGNILTNEQIKDFTIRAPETKPYIEKLSSQLSLTPQEKPPFEYLTRAITYQQLSGKAANTIYNRFLEKVGALNPKNVLGFDVEELKTCGLSRQKASYILNVANAFDKGGLLEEYNDISKMSEHTSDEIINVFSQIKGVGEWTVQMYLIFSLGRLDILTPADLGTRKGIQEIYQLDELPTPGIVKKKAKHWGDLATIGCLLCYKFVDGGLMD